MGKWQGKYVIGLTGNIATGKSVVRKMLEHLGAYGIDADALAHRVISKGAPGYKQVIQTFGHWILNAESEIDRKKLGRLVFSEPEALKRLEDIIHPYVNQAIEFLISRSGQQTIVIEAIKLLETELAGSCDSIWTTYSPENIQLKRLMSKRSMPESEALLRIRAQTSQQEKIKKATVVIRNSGSFEDTWHQVQAAWKGLAVSNDPVQDNAPDRSSKELVVMRGRPGDSQSIARFLSKMSNGVETQSVEDIMAAFGEKAFLLLKFNSELVGLAAWQVENLVARTTDIHVDENITLAGAIKALIEELERASRDLQCEASLLFLPAELAEQTVIWKDLGYEMRSSESLGIQAWQDAVRESMPPNTTLFFKQLRRDRILRPI